MKKLIASLLILVIGIGAVAAEGFEIEAYGGAGVEQFYASGFKDTRLSDAKYRGTLYSSSNNEGSLLLDLDDMNAAGMLITTQLGARYEVLPTIYALGEFSFGLLGLDQYVLQAEAGSLFMFPMGFLLPNLHLGVGIKVGYFDFTKNLGRAKILEGTTPPVKLSEGSIYNGYLIEFSSSGLSLTPMADITLDLSDHLALGFDVGFQWAISFKNALYAKADKDSDPISISTNSGNFYKPTSGTLTEMTMNPVVSLTGLKMNAHVMYRY